MSLTSASTFAEVMAAYRDNADWYEQQSVAKARAFDTAITHLISHLPETTKIGGPTSTSETTLNLELLYKQQQRVQRWLESQPAANGGSGDSAVLLCSTQDARP